MAIVLALAVVMGLAFGQGASFTRPAITPLLGFAMTLSLLGVSSHVFQHFRKLSHIVALSLLLNYLILGGIILLLSNLLVRDYEIWIGFVLLAAVPPAVAVVPFAYRLKGNIDAALVGAVATYLAALLITPLIYIWVLGINLVEPLKLFTVLCELIIGPLIVSRILLRIKVFSFLQKYRGTFVNWSFFFVTYTTIGLNRELIWGQPFTLLIISIVAAGSTFFLGYVIDLISRLMAVSKEDRISLILLGTTKNYGLAAAIALEFFSARTSMPMAICTIFAISYFIWLTSRAKKMR